MAGAPRNLFRVQRIGLKGRRENYDEGREGVLLGEVLETKGESWIQTCMLIHLIFLIL